jgi:hypothetical protein
VLEQSLPTVRVFFLGVEREKTRQAVQGRTFLVSNGHGSCCTPFVFRLFWVILSMTFMFTFILSPILGIA